MSAPVLSLREEVGAGVRAEPETVMFSELLVRSLHGLGIRQAFGLVGGAIAPLAHALARSPLHVFHFRHEGGAGFAALEASLASGRPTVVYATTGPGLTNALTPLWAARWEGARVLLLSGGTSPAQRGKWPAQETSAHTFPVGALQGPGAIFQYGCSVESPVELPAALARLAAGFARPEGFVAHLSLPLSTQTAQVPALRRPTMISAVPPAVDPGAVREVAELLLHEEVVIWAGYGARHASAELTALARRLRVPVMASPRAKGVFPETDPLYLGSTGLGGQLGVDRHFRARRVAHVLVLGTRLSEPTSYWSPTLVPTESFLHVDVEPSAFGAAYPEARTLGIQAEVKSFLGALLEATAGRTPSGRRPPEPVEAPEVLEDQPGPVRPQRVMEAVQRLIVEQTDAVVLSESGNAFAWSNQLLRFDEPERYRVSTGFGSMGHMTAGVVGLALARNGKAVALVGDGSMLMQNEVSSAVQYGAAAVWIVLNDQQYGMVEQGMRALGFTPLETAIPDTDFVAFARAQGADGVRVEREKELDAALEQAMRASRPFVVDVRIDGKQAAPWMRRIQNLIAQGAERPAGGVK